MYAENLTQTHADSEISTSVSVSAHEPTLFDFVGHDLLLSLTTRDPTIFLPLLTSAAAGSLSDDNWTRHGSIRLTEYYYLGILSLILFQLYFVYPRSLSHP